MSFFKKCLIVWVILRSCRPVTFKKWKFKHNLKNPWVDFIRNLHCTFVKIFIDSWKWKVLKKCMEVQLTSPSGITRKILISLCITLILLPNTTSPLVVINSQIVFLYPAWDSVLIYCFLVDKTVVWFANYSIKNFFFNNFRVKHILFYQIYQMKIQSIFFYH